MPELPEVETILRGLQKRLLRRKVASVEVVNPLVVCGSSGDFTRTITGRQIKDVIRKGKALAIQLVTPRDDRAQYLLARLGMTGQITVVRCDEPLQPHTHVRIRLDDSREELRFRDIRRFGRLRCCSPKELDSVFSRLGPDALDISEGEFAGALYGRRGPIKSWLMNQQIISGLGNIYADEALYVARIHPLKRAEDLTAVEGRRLHRAIRKVLERAIYLQGTSFRDYIDIEGRAGNYASKLNAYRRTGRPCRRCHHRIERLIIGGRSSHFCPQCQPRARRVASPTRRAD